MSSRTFHYYKYETLVMRWGRLRFWLCMLAFISLPAHAFFEQGGQRQENLGMALLLPDQWSPDDPLVTAWLDAAREEGVRLEPVTASAFLRPFPFRSPHYSGLILPDSVHKTMNETLIGGIHEYVEKGGKLMLVFDAGTLILPNNAYARHKSLFADLVGIDYALYDELKEDAIARSQVYGTRENLLSLSVPPGKFWPDQTVAPKVGNTVVTPPPAMPLAGEFLLTGYEYDKLDYPHYVTRGKYAGKVLLHTRDDQLIAGIHRYSRGQVLFANLPLGYLKTRTDGLLLHGLLHYFAVNLAQIPILANTPEGRGGLIMNWHIDSNAALPALLKLKKTKIFTQGPYSVHLTAGPDLDNPGDRLGLDLPDNVKAREWLEFFADRGDAIGTHGGWIHNYFGFHVNDVNRQEFASYILKNKQAIEAIARKPVTEYSAPLGKHPQWVSDWLDEHDIHAYYFTGDMGMGPTRPYRNDRRQANKAWAFPVLNMGKYAAFEEMHADNVNEQVVSEWLQGITEHVSSARLIRLVYFHPPGILRYLNAIDAWLQQCQNLHAANQFAWYTMTDVAEFLNQREDVTWEVTRHSTQEASFSARHPQALKRLAWRFPNNRFASPKITRGQADIVAEENFWLVRALGGQELSLSLTLRR